MPEHRDVSFVKIHIMIIIIKHFFLTFRAKKPYIVKWFKAFCTLPFLLWCSSKNHNEQDAKKNSINCWEFFVKTWWFHEFYSTCFYFFLVQGLFLDFWLSNCCNSCSMEKQFSRLCSSLLALTFLEVNEIYSVVNCKFLCQIGKSYTILGL